MTPENAPTQQPGPRPRSRTDTRRRILEATERLARALGPANLSLDAVAAEAGVSKGGLLYHFPSKALLLEAMVADHVDRLDAALELQERTGRRNAVIRSYLRHFLEEQDSDAPPPSGLLAALAENPRMLDPVRERSAAVLARIRSNAADGDFATLAYLAVQGLKTSDLLGTPLMTRADARALIGWVEARLSETAGDGA